LLVPPVAPPVYRELRARWATDYAYIEPFLARLRGLGVPYLDVLDPASFQSPDCEFVDGFHVGEVGAARILSRMRGVLDDRVLNLGALTAAVNRRAGHVSLDDRFAGLGEKEVDFLKLGCPK